jgi:3-hydroxyisobutyrate dehydrogenase
MRVGMIGTGLMGLPMAQRLHQMGHLSGVYNRSREKLQPLSELGVAIAPTPADLLQSSDCVVLMLSDRAAIEACLLTEPAKSLLAGKAVIQMGTIGASESQQLAGAIGAAGGEYLEAPVLGSIPEAKAGTLLVMVGGSAEQFERFSPLLSCFGPDPQLMGPVGHAAAIKLALNQLIGSLTTAFATSLGFLQHQGVALDPFMQVLRQSALYAPTFDKKLDRMVQRDFTRPNFPTKHLLKDLRLFLTESQDLPLDTQSIAAVASVLERAIALGLADSDYSALAQGLEG